jgi:hypothetical protein
MDVIGWDKIGAWIANNPQTVVDHLYAYFASEKETFLGRYFEPLAAQAAPTRFDGFDLAALWSLSVRVNRPGRQQLLHDRADELGELLTRCANTAHLGSGRLPLAPGDIDALTAKDSPFVELWNALLGIDDVGVTKASKLMAAKFPHLIPVWDSQIKALLGGKRDGKIWRPIHELLGERYGEDERSVAQLLNEPAFELLATDEKRKALRAALEPVSILRRLDVVLWMQSQQ